MDTIFEFLVSLGSGGGGGVWRAAVCCKVLGSAVRGTSVQQPGLAIHWGQGGAGHWSDGDTSTLGGAFILTSGTSPTCLTAKQQ